MTRTSIKLTAQHWWTVSLKKEGRDRTAVIRPPQQLIVRKTISLRPAGSSRVVPSAVLYPPQSGGHSKNCKRPPGDAQRKMRNTWRRSKAIRAATQNNTKYVSLRGVVREREATLVEPLAPSDGRTWTRCATVDNSSQPARTLLNCFPAWIWLEFRHNAIWRCSVGASNALDCVLWQHKHTSYLNGNEGGSKAGYVNEYWYFWEKL